MTKNPNPYLWYFAMSDEDEYWQGPYETKEGAISEGRGCYGGEAFVIRHANKSMVEENINGLYWAELIIEELVENNEECWFESEQHTAGAGPILELAYKLENAVRLWLIQHPWKGWCFDHIKETIIIPADEGSGE